MSRASQAPARLLDLPEPAWTPREREVLALLVRGFTNLQIAETLGISLGGAKWHVSEIITKLGVDSREEAAEYWRARNGLRLRFTRALRALLTGAVSAKAAGPIIGAALASVALVVAVVAFQGGGDDSAPMDAANLTACTPEELHLAMGQQPTGDTVAIKVSITADRPCRVQGGLGVSIDQGPGPDLTTSFVDIDEPLPSTNPASSSTAVVRIATWSNWCADSTGLTAIATLTTSRADHLSQLPVQAAPPCVDANRPSSFAWVASPTPTPSRPPVPPARLAVCDPATVTLALRQQDAGTSLVFDLDATSPQPCRLAERITVSVVDRQGHRVGAGPWDVLELEALGPLPARPVARFAWNYWCVGGDGFQVQTTLGGATRTFSVKGAPACPEVEMTTTLTAVLQPYTVVAGDTLAGIANRFGTTSASILALNPGVARDSLRVGQVLIVPPGGPGSLKASPTTDGEEITVQVYRGSARSGSPDCYDILAEMVPTVAAATAPGEPVKCRLDKSGRLTFLEDDHGVRFLDGVELLLVATSALPQPYRYSHCNDLRPYLVPASPKADPAAHILVCDVQPLPRGANPGQPLTIIARLPEGAVPATLPPDARCWELTRYLGGSGEAKTVPVSCVLD